MSAAKGNEEIAVTLGAKIAAVDLRCANSAMPALGRLDQRSRLTAAMALLVSYQMSACLSDVAVAEIGTNPGLVGRPAARSGRGRALPRGPNGPARPSLAILGGLGPFG